MSKPFSIRTEPWASFDQQSYNIVSDDFVHDKILTVKVNHKPLRAKKGETYKTLNEIKIWFPILASRNGTLYFRSKNDDIKIHYDDNLTQIKNSTQFSYYNFYASYQTQKNFKSALLKTGINLIGKNYCLDNRIRVGFSQSGYTQLSTGHKVCWAQDNWSFDTYNMLSLTNHSLLNNAIRIGYRANENEFFLRAHNQTARSAKKLYFTNLDTYFTNFIFDYVRKIDDLTRIGFETSFNKQGLGISSAVLQRSIPGRLSGIKAKISTDKSLAICYQALINNYGKWTIGWQVNDLGKTNKSVYGVQFDLNL